MHTDARATIRNPNQRRIMAMAIGGTAATKARLPRDVLRLGAIAPPSIIVLGVYTFFYDKVSSP